MNFQLKDANSGGRFEINSGTYGKEGGGSYTFAGNVGLPIGQTGFANLSLEYGNTNRTDVSIQRADAAGLIAAGNNAVAIPARRGVRPMSTTTSSFLATSATPVRERPATLRPHQLCRAEGDRKLLLSEPHR